MAPAIFFSVYGNGANKVLDRSMFVATLAGVGVYFYMLHQEMFTDFLMNAVPALITFGLGSIAWMGADLYQKQTSHQYQT